MMRPARAIRRGTYPPTPTRQDEEERLALSRTNMSAPTPSTGGRQELLRPPSRALRPQKSIDRLFALGGKKASDGGQVGSQQFHFYEQWAEKTKADCGLKEWQQKQAACNAVLQSDLDRFIDKKYGEQFKEIKAKSPFAQVDYITEPGQLRQKCIDLLTIRLKKMQSDGDLSLDPGKKVNLDGDPFEVVRRLNDEELLPPGERITKLAKTIEGLVNSLALIEKVRRKQTEGSQKLLSYLEELEESLFKDEINSHLSPESKEHYARMHHVQAVVQPMIEELEQQEQKAGGASTGDPVAYEQWAEKTKADCGLKEWQQKQEACNAVLQSDLDRFIDEKYGKKFQEIKANIPFDHVDDITEAGQLRQKCIDWLRTRLKKMQGDGDLSLDPGKKVNLDGDPFEVVRRLNNKGLLPDESIVKLAERVEGLVNGLALIEKVLRKQTEGPQKLLSYFEESLFKDEINSHLSPESREHYARMHYVQTVVQPMIEELEQQEQKAGGASTGDPVFYLKKDGKYVGILDRELRKMLVLKDVDTHITTYQEEKGDIYAFPEKDNDLADMQESLEIYFLKRTADARNETWLLQLAEHLKEACGSLLEKKKVLSKQDMKMAKEHLDMLVEKMLHGILQEFETKVVAVGETTSNKRDARKRDPRHADTWQEFDMRVRQEMPILLANAVTLPFLANKLQDHRKQVQKELEKADSLLSKRNKSKKPVDERVAGITDNVEAMLRKIKDKERGYAAGEEPYQFVVDPKQEEKILHEEIRKEKNNWIYKGLTDEITKEIRAKVRGQATYCIGTMIPELKEKLLAEEVRRFTEELKKSSALPSEEEIRLAAENMNESAKSKATVPFMEKIAEKLVSQFLEVAKEYAGIERKYGKAGASKSNEKYDWPPVEQYLQHHVRWKLAESIKALGASLKPNEDAAGWAARVNTYIGKRRKDLIQGALGEMNRATSETVSKQEAAAHKKQEISRVKYYQQSGNRNIWTAGFMAGGDAFFDGWKTLKNIFQDDPEAKSEIDQLRSRLDPENQKRLDLILNPDAEPQDVEAAAEQLPEETREVLRRTSVQSMQRLSVQGEIDPDVLEALADLETPMEIPAEYGEEVGESSEPNSRPDSSHQVPGNIFPPPGEASLYQRGSPASASPVRPDIGIQGGVPETIPEVDESSIQP